MLLMAAGIGWGVAVAQGGIATKRPTGALRFPNDEKGRWAQEANAVTIVRDDWGIAHIHGKSDADAVFGMIYAQCEDDFNRVEMNYLTSLGRTAEAEGEKAIWADLRQRLFLDPVDLKKDYAASPAWLRKLMDAWADGLNFYLATHPDVKPKVIARFEPWMALSFTEGSIGGDIERVDLKRLQDFYDVSSKVASDAVRPPVLSRAAGAMQSDEEPRGSNGFAIAPSNTRDHHALLLINPHTSFFFRSELKMESDEGLNAYGAVTWGQFFVYQGFNDRAGWMHTSSNVDAVDEYLETVTGKRNGSYLSGGRALPFRDKTIVLTYKTATGMASREFHTHASQHGPIVRKDGDKWVAVSLMNTPIRALEQSYLRTKARNYSEYRKTMELMGNSSNNTIFADADGDIAYWHGNFIPKRDTAFDFTKPVDGSNPATSWKGLLPLSEIPQLKNPASGYLFNVNDSPWNGSGISSLKKADFPVYVEQGIESARGLHAMRVLEGHKDFMLESLMASAYDSFLPWFARTIPALRKAWGTDCASIDACDPKPGALKDQVAMLRDWDQRWSAESEATTLAVYWGTEVMKTAGPAARAAGMPSEEWVATHMAPEALVQTLDAAVKKLQADFGDWRVEWGKVNRFQRLTGDMVQPFDDQGASIPVPFTSALWGSLASFGARQYPTTKKWYGTSGNSFVAVVEFGDKVRARAVTAGGESGHPASRHFNDEAERYAGGRLREVYFYPEQLVGHTERKYHPAE